MTTPKPDIKTLCVLDPDTEKCHFLRVDVTDKYYELDDDGRRDAKVALADSITD